MAERGYYSLALFHRYVRPWTGSALVQIMACQLFGTKPLPGPIFANGTLRNKHQWNLNQNTIFSLMEMHLELSSVKWWPFCSWVDIISIPYWFHEICFCLSQIVPFSACCKIIFVRYLISAKNLPPQANHASDWGLDCSRPMVLWTHQRPVY